MKIKVNDKIFETDSCISIQDLLKIFFKQKIGTAVAVNSIIIPRTQWVKHILNDNDEVVFFKAIAGG